MITPSPDFKQWLYCGNVGHPKSIELRNFLKNHTNWAGHSIDELKIYLDDKGLTPFTCECLIEAMLEYHSYKKEALP